jgi:CheY-like chemotaxis protein
MMDERPRHIRPLVLLVEDDPLIRWASAEALNQAGFGVIEAADAQAAFAILQSRSDVSVLFTDVEMPGRMDGLELARRARELWPALRILVTSGRGAPPALTLPARGRFVSKPYAQDEIVRDIGRLLAA